MKSLEQEAQEEEEQEEQEEEEQEEQEQEEVVVVRIFFLCGDEVRDLDMVWANTVVWRSSKGAWEALFKFFHGYKLGGNCSEMAIVSANGRVCVGFIYKWIFLMALYSCIELLRNLCKVNQASFGRRTLIIAQTYKLRQTVGIDDL